jgi:hypothetical protein
MEASPTSMAAVTFTLIDAVISRLVDKGLLEREDLLAIFQQARSSLANADDPQMRAGLELLDHLYTG